MRTLIKQISKCWHIIWRISQLLITGKEILAKVGSEFHVFPWQKEFKWQEGRSDGVSLNISKYYNNIS